MQILKYNVKNYIRFLKLWTFPVQFKRYNILFKVRGHNKGNNQHPTEVVTILKPSSDAQTIQLMLCGDKMKSIAT